MLRGNENLHDEVYGKTFALYTKSELEDFIYPFEVRLKKNNIYADEIFSGKKCLDAGCGGGRGTILMAKYGARFIESVDVSDINIKTTLSNSKKFGFESLVKTTKSNLADLPFPDEYFDFVWCNGVIMHTCDPSACLKEITRVLKKGGKAWIYVYGTGGIYWHCVDLYRKYLEKISIDDCIEIMKGMDIKNGYIAEYIDDWNTPYLRTYTDNDFKNALETLGFHTPFRLMYGMDYDTSHRLACFPEDNRYLGEGDLRYFVEKKEHITNNRPLILTDHSKSHLSYTYEGKDKVKIKIGKLNRLIPRSNNLKRIKYFSMIQRFLRDELLSSKYPFDFNKFISFVDQTTSQVEEE